MNKKRHEYSADFKRKVLLEYQEKNETMREIGARFNISCGTISKWLAQQKNFSTSDDSGEIAKLKAENRQMKYQLEIMRSILKEKFLNNNKWILGLTEEIERDF